MEKESSSKIDVKAASVPFIFATIFLDALGIGVIIPTLPDVIRRFTADPMVVSQYFGYFISIYAFMQLIASPVLGSLSDHYGRRPVLLVSLFGAGLDYILMALAPNLWILFFGRVIAGSTGASMTVASSYMADISTDANRSKNFGLIGAAFGLGFIIGPAAGGLLSAYGPTAPFFLAAALNLLNFAFGYFVLPESLKQENRRELTFSNLNPFKSLGKVIFSEKVRGLIVIYFLIMLAGQSHPSVWTLYAEYKFAWTPFEVGLSLSVVGLSIAIVQGGLTGVIVPRLGEERSLNIGLWIALVSYFLFGIATQGWMVYVILVFSALSGVAMPALQSIMVRSAKANEQGELQGSLMSVMSLTAIIGPLLYTGLFSHFTKPGRELMVPGAPYYAGALIGLIAWALFVKSTRVPKQVSQVETAN